jgi:hypothetical protein
LIISSWEIATLMLADNNVEKFFKPKDEEDKYKAESESKRRAARYVAERMKEVKRTPKNQSFCLSPQDFLEKTAKMRQEIQQYGSFDELEAKEAQ